MEDALYNNSGDYQFNSLRTPRAPHYATDTLTCSLPSYANAEQDVIRQAFHTGNYTWMKHLLPVELAPDAVNTCRRKRMEQNRVGDGRPPRTWSKMTGLWGGGYYQEFEFMPDPYDNATKEMLRERKADVEKRIECGHSLDWHAPGDRQRLKYEPMFVSKEELDDPRAKKTDEFYLRPDPTLLAADTQNESSEPLSFLTGSGAGLNNEGKMSRTGMQPIIRQKLQKKLEVDWDDADVSVTFTDQGLVQIAFCLDSVDSERGVIAYMNILSKNDDSVNSLGLRKVSQLWGVTRCFAKDIVDADSSQSESTWMFFLMCPQWVRMRATDAYYTAHPRSEGSQFRMSKAGSSVLFSLATQKTQESHTEERKETRARVNEERMPNIDMLKSALRKA